jgi:hypothetical protein
MVVAIELDETLQYSFFFICWRIQSQVYFANSSQILAIAQLKPQ